MKILYKSTIYYLLLTRLFVFCSFLLFLLLVQQTTAQDKISCVVDQESCDVIRFSDGAVVSTASCAVAGNVCSVNGTACSPPCTVSGTTCHSSFGLCTVDVIPGVAGGRCSVRTAQTSATTNCAYNSQGTDILCTVAHSDNVVQCVAKPALKY